MKDLKKKMLLLILTFSVIMSISIEVSAKDNAKIHFINLKSDTLAVLVECNGEFGMIDSGEDSEYPIGEDPRYPYRDGIVKIHGFEDEVISYMKSVGVTKENFEFYIGTHPHSDHIGTADDVIREFCPKRVYTPEYHDYYISPNWFLFDNLFVYDEMLEAAEEVGADIILHFDPNAPVVPEQNGISTAVYNPDDPYDDYPAQEGKYEHISEERNTVGNPDFTLGGEMKIKIKNYKDIDTIAPFVDANRMSLGVLIEANGVNAYVAGDIENNFGDEDRLIGELPEVDIYCMGHHGLLQANSYDFVNYLSPEVMVMPGEFIHMPNIKKSSSRSSVYKVIEEQNAKGVPIYPTASYGDYIPAMVFNFDNNLSNNIPTGIRYLGKLQFSETYFSYKDGFPSNYVGELSYGNHRVSFDGNYISGASCFVYGVDHWMYLKNDGTYAKGWITDNGNSYFLDENGFMKTGWQYLGDKFYYFNNSGIMLKGWQYINKNWFYFNEAGHMLTDWQYIDGNWFYMNSSGAMQKGWQYIDSNWYYMNSSGAMQKGWQYIDSNWYYMNKSGVMLKGWQYVDGNWFYMNNSGVMLKGWQYIDSNWYYMNGSGAMQKGWQYIDSNWYYMNNSGIMLKGWQYVDGNWFYMNNSGVMLKGWQYIDGKWYYMNNSGNMQTGWQYINGKWYYMNKSGNMQTGWKYIGGKWYYFYKSGCMR